MQENNYIKEKIINTVKSRFEVQSYNLIIKGNPFTSILEKALGKDGYEKFSREVIFYYN